MKKVLVACAAALLPLVVVQPAQADVIVDEGVVGVDGGAEITRESVPDGSVKIPKGVKSGDRVGDTTYYVLGSCTTTITPSTPYRGWKNGIPAAFGTVSFYRSSGCSKTWHWAHLQFYSCDILGYCRWRQRAVESSEVRPGEKFQVRLWRTCVDTSQGRWRTRGEMPEGNVDWSGVAWLACDT